MFASDGARVTVTDGKIMHNIAQRRGGAVSAATN